MFMLRYRRNLVVPALFVATVGASQAFLGQVPANSLVEPGSVSLSTVQPPAHQRSAEENGDSLVSQLHYQAAIDAYSKAPEMTATLWNKMGIAYQMMFNSKEASRCYRESLKIDSRNPQVLNNLGTIYASMKQYAQADHFYHKALKIDPRNATIMKNLGTNLLAEKRYDKGWKAYQDAIAINPQIFADSRNNPKVENPASLRERGAMNYYMAMGCARSGYSDCAIEYLRAALDEGFIDRKKVAADAEFVTLRTNPGFQRLLGDSSAQ
jgi:tetratricopeptide (TPR) repeat protein